MSRFKLLTVLLVFIATWCSGQTKSFEIVFVPSKCDSCKTNSIDTNFDYQAQYFNLKHSIIELALDNALKNNDKRVVAISGVSILFPGLETENAALKTRYSKYLSIYGYKVVWGTSDVVNLSVPGLQSAAYEFAKNYNTLLFRRLDEK